MRCTEAFHLDPNEECPVHDKEPGIRAFCIKDFLGHSEERATGLEPVTSSLGSWHSTTELRPHILTL